MWQIISNVDPQECAPYSNIDSGRVTLDRCRSVKTLSPPLRSGFENNLAWSACKCGDVPATLPPVLLLLGNRVCRGWHSCSQALPGTALLEFGATRMKAKEAACGDHATLVRVGGRIQAEPFSAFTRMLLLSPSSVFAYREFFSILLWSSIRFECLSSLFHLFL